MPRSPPACRICGVAIPAHPSDRVPVEQLAVLMATDDGALEGWVHRIGCRDEALKRGAFEDEPVIRTVRTLKRMAREARR